jgi:hypothetical protein
MLSDDIATISSAPYPNIKNPLRVSIVHHKYLKAK